MISEKSQLLSIDSFSLFWLSTDFKREPLLPMNEPLMSVPCSFKSEFLTEFLIFMKVWILLATSP
jgi:hypothetical protein